MARPMATNCTVAFHFPHYIATRNRTVKPHSALVVGGEKLVRFYESGTLELYDLEANPRERKDLSAERAERAAELDALLTRHLEAAGAALPTPREREEGGR